MSAELDPTFYTILDTDKWYKMLGQNLDKETLDIIAAMEKETFAEWCKVGERVTLKYMLWEYRYEQ